MKISLNYTTIENSQQKLITVNESNQHISIKMSKQNNVSKNITNWK